MRNLLLIVLSALFCFPANALESKGLSELPLLHEGRIKPLDTFARIHLQRFYGDEKMPKLSASDWLAEALFDPQQALQRPLFHIASPTLRSALKLPNQDPPRYTYRQLSEALSAQEELLQRIAAKDPAQHAASEQQLWQLYHDLDDMTQISGAMSLLLPLDLSLSEPLKKRLKVTAPSPYNYLDLIKHSHTLQEETKEIARRKGENLNRYNKEEQEIVALSFRLTTLEGTGLDNTLLRVIPSRWSGNSEWFSPWMLINSGQGSPETVALLKAWEQLARAYHSDQQATWDEALGQIHMQTVSLSKASDALLKLEQLYNRLHLTIAALALYVLAFALVLVGYFGHHRSLVQRAAMGTMATAFFVHSALILTRMILLGRPPVSTLYESILFVGWIAALYGLVLARKRGMSEGLVIGSFLAALLLSISGVYASQGDTMGMLIAVLNTNFWLATHVVCITVGYGCALIAGTMAHLALFTPTSRLWRSLTGATLAALLFTAIGTILGGIWADQSWGRFWGWDPKENGALLIVLWLIWLLHGQMTAHLNRRMFAALLALTNVVVALSWFGVNLLNVGLHSYGFTDSAALGLGAFCASELMVVAALYVRHRQKTQA